MHAPDLEVGGDDLQVGVEAPQLVLLQLCADVLGDEVDGHDVGVVALSQQAAHRQPIGMVKSGDKQRTC